MSGQSMPGGELPDGAKVHIAGPTESGWRVITVWDTEEQFNTFRNDRLIPALQAAGGEGRIAPDIKVDAVHKLITA